MNFVLETIETPTLTKNDLVEAIYSKVGINKREAKDIVDFVFDEVANQLTTGVEYRLSGFGNFQLKHKSARPGRNPRTGELIPIESRCVVVFHASQRLKALLDKPAELA